MRSAEATSREVLAQLSRALAGERCTAGPEGSAGEFASMLSAMRRGSQPLADLLKRGQQSLPPRQDRLVQENRAARADDERAERQGRNEAPRPSRVDRLRGMVDGGGHELQVQADAVSDASRAEQAQASEQAEFSAHGQEIRAEHGAGPAWPPAGSTDPVPAGGPVAADMLAPGSMVGGDQGAIAVPAGVSAAGQNATNTAVTAWTGSGTQDSSMLAVPTADGAGRARLMEAPPAGSTGKGENPNGAAPSGGKAGSPGEFQNLLNDLGRGRVAGPEAHSSGSAAKPRFAGKGVDPPIDPRSVESLKELARILRLQAGPRHSSMTLMMSPPELGRLRIEMRMEADGLAVRFQAETLGGHEAVKARLAELKGAIEQQGIQLDRVDVEFFPAHSAGDAEREGPDRHQYPDQWRTSDQSDRPSGDAGQPGDDRGPAGAGPGGGDTEGSESNWPHEEASASEQLEAGFDLVA